MLLAVAMIGLICIGLMGLGGVVYFTMNSRLQEEAAIPPTPTPIPPTPTLTATSTPTPTETPLPTSTPTRVIPVEGGPTESSQTPVVEEGTATPTGTRILEAATPGAGVGETTPTSTPAVAMPGGGGVLQAGNGLLGWAGVGVLLLLVLGVVNHFKLFSPRS